MFIKNLIWAGLFAAVTIFCIPVHARTHCSSSTVCSVNNLPAYNQNSSGLLAQWNSGNGTTNLCVPTAAAMALMSLNGDPAAAKAGTVAAKVESLSGQDAKIKYLAGLMHTTVKGGTLWSDDYAIYGGTYDDFATAYSRAWIKNSPTLAVNHSQVLAQMRAGRVTVLNFGHYYTTCANLLSATQKCTYTRNGGHSLAVKAMNNTNLTFIDPIGGVAKTMPMTRMPSNAVMPSSTFSASTAIYLKINGTYAAVVENIIGVGSTSNLN